MALSYCPNCRSPVSEKTLGWICWRTYRSVSATDSTQSNDTQEEGRAIFGSSSAGQTSYHQDEDELCKTYNTSGIDKCSNDRCGGNKERATALPACPHCRMELPPLENISPRTLTVAGPSGVGKTTYIVALHEWWQRNLGRFRLAALPAMGERIQQLFKIYRQQVVRNAEVLPATTKGKLVSFTWQITPPAHSGLESLLFTLPDVAGESTMSPEALARNRHYHNSSGVILLLDGDRVATTQGLVDTESNRDPMDHLEAAQAMIQDMMRRLPPDEFRALPIAVCVNKMDMLCRLDHQWDEIMALAPQHTDGFDYYTCAERSQAIESMLLGYGDTATVAHLIRNNFDNVMFFGMATLGSDTRPLKWRPMSVEDPFLWLMWHLGYVGLAPGQQ